MTNTAQWECPHCGQRYPTQHEALRHMLRIHEDRTSAPLLTVSPTSEYVNLTAPHLGGVQRARRGYTRFAVGPAERARLVKTAQEDAAEINRTLPRLQARAEGEDVTLKCGCGNVFFFKHDNPAWEQCDECLDAAPRP